MKERQVTVDEASQFAQQQRMAYLEASAALNININKIFEMLSSKIYQLYKQKNVKKLSDRISVLSAIDGASKPKRKCCEWV